MESEVFSDFIQQVDSLVHSLEVLRSECLTDLTPGIEFGEVLLSALSAALATFVR